MNPISKAISKMAYRHSQRDIFRDFVEMGAICLSNAVDWPQREKREERFLQVEKKYDPEERKQVGDMLGMLVLELETNPRDVLGETYMELEMGNDRTGQFFTPYHLSVMMAKMTASDVSPIIAEKGYVTVQEPAVGAGGMVIALAGELADQEINYQQCMHVTAVDIDPICVHMAYLQFSLLHIPAVVVHGNTLSLEEWGRWYTPAHIMGGWDWRLRARKAVQAVAEIAADVTQPFEKMTSEPVLSLFDGTEITEAKQKPERKPKVDAKQDFIPNPQGTQLSLF